jgi:peptidoglycan/LPS O-acetylase OafA/YrhL
VTSASDDGSQFVDSSQATAQKGLVKVPKYQAYIEGLRAIAILLVIGYHADLPGLSGGYIGVDIFFVISGYLITWLLIYEMESTGTFNLAKFYAKRVKRLLPAATLMLGVTALISMVLYAPFEQQKLAESAFATATYRSNLYFAQAALDYLGANIETNPLLHTWSLSVEEQFYLLWPLILMGVAGIGFAKGRAPQKPLRYWRILSWILFISVVSFCLSIYLLDKDRVAAFFTPFPRAWEFSIGAIALLIPTIGRDSRLKRDILGWVGLLGLFATCVAFDKTTTFPGYAALLPTLFTVFILRACDLKAPTDAQLVNQPEAEHTPWIARLLSLPLLQSIGKISYSWYLWHWPVLVFASLLSIESMSLPLRVGVLAMSLVPAIASYHFVENPIRRHSFLSKRPLRGLAVIALVAALCGSLSLGWAAVAGEWSQRPNQALYTATRKDAGAMHNSACHGDYFVETPPPLETCSLKDFKGGSQSSLQKAPKVVLLGDSHAAQWYDVLAAIAQEQGWSLTALTKSTCPYADIATTRPGIGKYTTCITWRNNAIKALKAFQPDLVILASTMYPFSEQEWFEGTNRTIEALSGFSKQVVMIRNSPRPGVDVPLCLARNQWRMGGILQNNCELSAEKSLTDKNELTAYEAQKAVAQAYENVATIDVNSHICKVGDCAPQRGDIVVYRDSSHLSVKFTLTLKDILYKELGGFVAKAI